MGATITIRRRGNFRGDYAHVLKGKNHLFRVIKHQDDTFSLLRKNNCPLKLRMSEAELNEILGKFQKVRVELNEGDVVLR